jgi:hypothetical protein
VPFTVSHVAAVIPLHWPLSHLRVFTAAVIGSMVPDFGLLVPIPLARVQTHSIAALFTFCLPVGLISYWLTQVLIRPAVREALPDGAYARLPGDDAAGSLWRWQHWLLVTAALLFGAGTHLAWDLFTHEDSRGTRWFPALNDYGPDLHGHPEQITRWLQYGSSGFGLLVVLSAMALWWWHTRGVRPPRLRRLEAREAVVWFSAYLLLPLAAVAWHFRHPLPRIPVGWLVRDIVIAGMRGTATALLLVSALLRLRLTASGR